MPASIDWDPRDKVSKLALEVARIATEAMGHTKFDQLREHFNQTMEQDESDMETKVRALTRLLIQKTRRGVPQSVADIQTAGLCLIWLSGTRVADWSLLQLYQWGESLPSD
jgi:hypothetical protein